MKLHVENPIRMRIEDGDAQRLQLALQYHDQRVDYELNKFKHNRWYADKYGLEAYQEKLAALKSERTKSLYMTDERGVWTYTGLAEHITKSLGYSPVSTDVTYPEAQPLPWNRDPLKPYPYQQVIIEKMLAARHCAVEVATGLGKTLCILYILRSLGLKSVVMAPSISIAGQIVNLLTHGLGKKYVGMYGNGRHDSDKLITVATAQSLAKIEKSSAPWKELSASSVFVADESHLCPASTLSKVCFGLMASAPYRFFFSGTQMRNDGLDLLLDAITGPVVYRMSVADGVAAGYLANLNFTMLKVDSDLGYFSRDANEMTRAHLYYNDSVNRKVADTINRLVGLCKYQVLVLVEELEQFAKLLPMLRHEAAFAHSGTGADVLPLEYQKSDPDKLVARFNDGKLPILVGTSCISTGTDIKANQATVYLRGGRSEIEVMQGAVGRSTRLCPLVGKKNCHVIDVDVSNVETLHRHALARRKIYEQVAPVRELRG